MPCSLYRMISNLERVRSKFGPASKTPAAHPPGGIYGSSTFPQRCSGTLHDVGHPHNVQHRHIVIIVAKGHHFCQFDTQEKCRPQFLCISTFFSIFSTGFGSCVHPACQDTVPRPFCRFHCCRVLPCTSRRAFLPFPIHSGTAVPAVPSGCCSME